MERIGRYEIMRKIGSGGMGIVYEGYDPNLDRRVAIKTILSPEADEELTARMRQEARAAGKLSHPHVVMVHDVFEELGKVCIVMEYVEGKTLEQEIPRGAQASAGLVIRVAEQCGEALDYAHSHGVVHRDIKPANVMLDSFGRAKIADFGLAKLMSTGMRSLTKTGMLMGTPEYMSPEQCMGKFTGDGRSDQYSLAGVVYRLLAGRPVFQAEHPFAVMYSIIHELPAPVTAHNSALPAGADAVLLRALEKNAEQRYRTCLDFAKELKHALKGDTATPVAMSHAVATPAMEVPPQAPPAPAIVVADSKDPVHRPEAEHITLPAPRKIEVKKARFVPAVKVNPRDGQRYVWIPPGKFRMGGSSLDANSYKDEMPEHSVTLTKGFWIGETPVTQAAYEKVRGSNPSQFKSPNRPVDSVTWMDAAAFCAAAGGRLPTEAEWEFAARGGDPWPSIGSLEETAWFMDNSEGHTHDVGQRLANGYALYDTLGNVFEWVLDWFGPYAQADLTDPTGPASGIERVLRGGSWYTTARMARVSSRFWAIPKMALHTIGIRCVVDVL